MVVDPDVRARRHAGVAQTFVAANVTSRCAVHDSVQLSVDYWCMVVCCSSELRQQSVLFKTLLLVTFISYVTIRSYVLCIDWV